MGGRSFAGDTPNVVEGMDATVMAPYVTSLNPTTAKW
jgi:hypothetical protein